MSSHRLTYRGTDRYHDRDAYSVTLDWERDGESLGIAEAVITGQDLLGLSVPTDARFWAAVAICAADAVADHVSHGEGREAWERTAFSVAVIPASAATVSLTDQAPKGYISGDLVKEFDAE